MQPLAFAGTAALPGKSSSPQSITHVADIALQPGGVLEGQVFDSAGVGQQGVLVRLTRGRSTSEPLIADQQIRETKTDANGWFQLSDLEGGSYQFDTAGHSQSLRAWAPGTAPPSASPGLLVAPTTDVVRGQRVVSPNTNQFFRVAKRRLANPLVFGGVVATAVAIPVALHNADDDPPATP